MGRPIMLGNGALTVGLNESGLVHDFYYPYVGLDNLATSRRTPHKIGVFVDERFSWVDDGSWEIALDFETEALISSIVMRHDDLAIELRLMDFVDHDYNAFFRRIRIKNLADQDREVRLFMHQVYQISSGGRADTGLFVPEDNYLLDYKGRCCLLTYAQDEDGRSFDQFAIGNYGIEGKEGTFKDAEDGELSGSAVEHGGVDSVLRFKWALGKDVEKALDYWTIAADSQFAAEKVHHVVKRDGVDRRLESARRFWRHWLSTAADRLHALDKPYLDSVKKSLMAIKAHTDRRGGIIASCDSSIYNYGRDYYSYVWPRDGAYVIWPLIRLGYTEEPKKFFEFCRDILTADGYLMHKYQPDRAIGSTWHPLLHNNRRELAIQEDETSIVIFMLGEYLNHSGDEEFVRSLYATMVKPTADFIEGFIDEPTGLPHASYDLWEEKFLTTTYTVAVTGRALVVAAELAERFEHPDDALRWRSRAESIFSNLKVLFDPERQAYRKGYLLQPDGSLQFDNTLDVSSFYGAAVFAPTNQQPDVEATLKAIEDILLDSTPSGGSPRYENDNYFLTDEKYLGNPWAVTTLWLAQYYARAGQTDTARRYVDWALSRATPSGMLAEQFDPESGQPVSVLPLVWSHAELINTMIDLSEAGQAQ